jgi:hypothetical protein
MKIELGPYKNWFGPYQLAEKILFWKDRDDDLIMTLGDFIAHGKWEPYTPEYDIFKKDERSETWLYKLMQWYEKKKTRKIKIRIDPYDTWSMDTTLAKIVYPMLLQLKVTNHGFAQVDPLDVPENLRAVDGEYSYSDQLPLFDMEVINPEYITIEEARWDWVMDEMIYAFSILSDDDKVWLADDNDRVNNGCRLFGKYYRALWD